MRSRDHRLAALMSSKNERDAIAARVAVLERGYGKPRQVLEHGLQAQAPTLLDYILEAAKKREANRRTERVSVATRLNKSIAALWVCIGNEGADMTKSFGVAAAIGAAFLLAASNANAQSSVIDVQMQIVDLEYHDCHLIKAGSNYAVGDCFLGLPQTLISTDVVGRINGNLYMFSLNGAGQYESGGFVVNTNSYPRCEYSFFVSDTGNAGTLYTWVRNALVAAWKDNRTIALKVRADFIKQSMDQGKVLTPAYVKLVSVLQVPPIPAQTVLLTPAGANQGTYIWNAPNYPAECK